MSVNLHKDLARSLDRALHRPDPEATCEVHAGTLVAACPNPAVQAAEVNGTSRPVCKAHSQPLARPQR